MLAVDRRAVQTGHVQARLSGMDNNDRRAEYWGRLIAQVLCFLLSILLALPLILHYWPK